MTLRALVIDDEPLARDELIFLVGEVGGVTVVGQAGDVPSGLALAEELEPDLVFVDLRMPGPDGLALTDALHARGLTAGVIVVTAHDEGAVRGFESGVLDYLLKPVRLERLAKAIERARTRLRPASEPAIGDRLERLAVRRRGSFVVVDIDDVVYFEMRDELVWAVTATDRFALDFTLATVEERLPPGKFFRSHRGYVVRVDRILAMEPAGAGTFDLLLDHPEQPRVPLARERARILRERIPIAG